MFKFMSVFLALVFVPPVDAQGTSAEPLTRLDDALSTYVDASGQPDTFTTDAFGQVTNAVNAVGLSASISRNSRGNALTTVFPSGSIIDQTYDSQGNISSHTDQTLGGTTQLEYTVDFNKPSRILRPLGGQITADYDTNGNRIRIVSADSRQASMSYSASGQLVSVTDALGSTATANFDSIEQIVSIDMGSSANARQETHEYNEFGYLIALGDPEGGVTTLDYDVMGRVSRATLPDSRLIDYRYDAGGNLVSLTPPGSAAYLFSYNSVGLRLSEQYPPVAGGGSNQTQYAYNSERRLERVTRADDSVVDFNYDAIGRPLNIMLPNGSYTYSYNATTGLPSSIVSPYGVGLNLTQNGNLMSLMTWTGGLQGSVGFNYDARGRLSTLTIENAAFAYTYDLDDNVVQAGKLSLGYDAASGLLTSTSLDAIDESFQYNEFSELIRHTVTSGPTTLYDVRYSRDKLSRVTQRLELIGGVTTTYDYGYDAGGRLRTVLVDSVLIATYNYDSRNNRLTNGATFDVQNRLLATSDSTFSYNAPGERVRKTTGGNTSTYDFDSSGVLIGAGLSNGDRLDYLLDGHRRRVARQLNGVTTSAWLYGDILNPVARLDSSNTTNQRYIYADRAFVPSYIESTSGRFKTITDHVGSIRLVIDSTSAVVVQRIDYGPWGVITADTNPGFQPFGFAGGMYDSGTGLTHFGLREYDPETAQWTSQDPLGFDGSAINLYGYVLADPINRIDPTGLELPKERERSLGKRFGKGQEQVSRYGEDILDLTMRPTTASADYSTSKRNAGEGFMNVGTSAAELVPGSSGGGQVPTGLGGFCWFAFKRATSELVSDDMISAAKTRAWNAVETVPAVGRDVINFVSGR